MYKKIVEKTQTLSVCVVDWRLANIVVCILGFAVSMQINRTFVKVSLLVHTTLTNNRIGT